MLNIENIITENTVFGMNLYIFFCIFKIFLFFPHETYHFWQSFIICVMCRVHVITGVVVYNLCQDCVGLSPKVHENLLVSSSVFLGRFFIFFFFFKSNFSIFFKVFEISHKKMAPRRIMHP